MGLLWKGKRGSVSVADLPQMCYRSYYRVVIIRSFYQRPPVQMFDFLDCLLIFSYDSRNELQNLFAITQVLIVEKCFA